jgi:hypothetical protein
MDTSNPNNATNEKQPSKRLRSASSPEKDDDTELSITENNVENSFWPRFLVIEPTDSKRPLSVLSPFVLGKAMRGIVGTAKAMRQLRTGQILIEVDREGQSKNLLKLTELCTVPVKVSAHRTLNSSKGVIRSFDLARMNPAELVAELSDQGVISALNIKQRRDGIERITPVIILTFSMPTPPKEIFAEYLRLKVDVYVPNPLRCFKCQQFGHHQSTCRREKVCPKCGMSSHDEEPCTHPAKCVNCTGSHPAYATSCPRWVQEKEICQVKVTNNISFPEARKIVSTRSQHTHLQHSYAATARSEQTLLKHTYVTAAVEKKTVATQTDVTNCTCIPSVSLDTDEMHTTETQTDTIQVQPRKHTAGRTLSVDREGRGGASSLSPKVRVSNTATAPKVDTVAGPSGQWANVPNRKHLKDRGKFPSSSKTDDGVNMTPQARDNAPRQAIGYP